jgi:hypothetical protein
MGLDLSRPGTRIEFIKVAVAEATLAVNCEVGYPGIACRYADRYDRRAIHGEGLDGGRIRRINPTIISMQKHLPIRCSVSYQTGQDIRGETGRRTT